MKHKYHLECIWERPEETKWVRLYEDCGIRFAEGYLECLALTPGPRIEHRLVRDDGKVVDMQEGTSRAGIGMVAGFPTAEQYEAAAAWCLSLAADVRQREALRK